MMVAHRPLGYLRILIDEKLVMFNWLSYYESHLLNTLGLAIGKKSWSKSMLFIDKEETSWGHRLFMAQIAELSPLNHGVASYANQAIWSSLKHYIFA